MIIVGLSGFIILIPKKSGAIVIKDCCLISLVGNIYISSSEGVG
jgi:hypothetical protein